MLGRGPFQRHAEVNRGLRLRPAVIRDHQRHAVVVSDALRGEDERTETETERRLCYDEGGGGRKSSTFLSERLCLVAMVTVGLTRSVPRRAHVWIKGLGDFRS